MKRRNNRRVNTRQGDTRSQNQDKTLLLNLTIGISAVQSCAKHVEWRDIEKRKAIEDILDRDMNVLKCLVRARERVSPTQYDKDTRAALIKERCALESILADLGILLAHHRSENKHKN